MGLPGPAAKPPAARGDPPGKIRLLLCLLLCAPVLAASERPFALPPLPYAFEALEPWIDAETMSIHHGRHHKAYVDNLNKLMRKSIKPEFSPKRQGDVRKTFADISKMKKKLGLTPSVNFEEGIKRTLDWFQSREVKIA